MEREQLKGPIGQKLLPALSNPEYTQWFMTVQDTCMDGFKMLKELMRHNIRALEPPNVHTVHAITTPEPVYKNNMDTSTFHARYTIWLMVENREEEMHQREQLCTLCSPTEQELQISRSNQGCTKSMPCWQPYPT